MGRTASLDIYGPPQLEQIVNLQLEVANTQLRYSLTFHSTQTEEKELLLEADGIKVYSFPLIHRIPTTGFLFVERPGKRRIDKKAIRGLNLKPEHFAALKEGRSIDLGHGRTFRNDELTLAPRISRQYAFCSDTKYHPELNQYVRDVDLMYHEATFLIDDGGRAAETFHSTAKDAAQAAIDTNSFRLLIGHFSSKYRDIGVYLDEARQTFSATALADEGLTFDIERRPR